MKTNQCDTHVSIKGREGFHQKDVEGESRGAGTLPLNFHTTYPWLQRILQKKDIYASSLTTTGRKGCQTPLLIYVLKSLADCIEDTAKTQRPGPSALCRFKDRAA